MDECFVSASWTFVSAKNDALLGRCLLGENLFSRLDRSRSDVFIRRSTWAEGIRSILSIRSERRFSVSTNGTSRRENNRPMVNGERRVDPFEREKQFIEWQSEEKRWSSEHVPKQVESIFRDQHSSQKKYFVQQEIQRTENFYAERKFVESRNEENSPQQTNVEQEKENLLPLKIEIDCRSEISFTGVGSDLSACLVHLNVHSFFFHLFLIKKTLFERRPICFVQTRARLVSSIKLRQTIDCLLNDQYDLVQQGTQYLLIDRLFERCSFVLT